LSSVQGKASGVQIFNSATPGSSPRVDIRGIGSLTGSTVYIVDGSITSVKIASGLLTPAIANSAAGYANSAFISANSAGVYANSGFSAANSASLYANSSFLKANTPDYVANSAASYANGAFATANTVIDTAGYANSAFTKANTAASTGKAIAMSIVFG
jgi:hypothetical protein